jgi:hypothetical protein
MCRSWNRKRLKAKSSAPRDESRGCVSCQQTEENMRPTTANDNVFDFNALLHPGTVFEHPRDVVDHCDLTLAQKRAILASWASDASAIASCPAMSAPSGLKTPVSIDEILEALCALDGGPALLPAENRAGCGRQNVRSRLKHADGEQDVRRQKRR